MTIGVLGHVIRRGRPRLPRRTLTVSVFAGIDLDLRGAQIDDSCVTVGVLPVFGNVDVYVPEGVDVEVDGLLVGGHRRDWGANRGRPGTPARCGCGRSGWTSGASPATCEATTAN